MSHICYFVNEIRTPFVINDIRRVAEKYKTVFLFSVDELQGKETLPENVLVFEAFIDWKQFKPLRILLRNFFSILTIYLNESIALKRLLPLKKSVAVLVSNILKAEQILEIVRTLSVVEAPAYYSFWFYDCIYLAWMRKKGWIDKAVTRAHGGDLFEERGSLSGKILLRNFQTKYLDAVLSVSDEGTEYLQKRYPETKNKIKTVFLGSQDDGANPFDTTCFTIVSCARVRNIKRIHKIAEMLRFISFPLTWIHIGSENLEAKNDPTIPIYHENKEKLKDYPNVSVVTKGLMNNQEVLNLYKNTPINLFISLSEAEGIPVSMMEAISFGIPILSTDVGGCKEIVNEKTGVLIPLETSMEEVAEIITEFKNSSKNTIEFRKGVREFWEEYFDADKNYGKLFEEIVG